MTSNNCKYYDEENGWCKLLTDWSTYMPKVKYCVDSPCSFYERSGYQMIINTKFNIGDPVYVARIYDEPYACKDQRVITDILINGNPRHVNIQYEVLCNGRYDIVSEGFVFETYEDCVKWCEKYN